MGTTNITNNTSPSRIEIDVSGEKARLDYHLREKAIAVMYVFVPPKFRGTGVGGKLVMAAVDLAIKENKKLMLYCGFAASYVRAHKELYQYVDTDFHPDFKL